MGTSRSTEDRLTAKSRAIARAYVFSGRPDPTWEVGENLVQRLEGIWRTLSEFHGLATSPPPLGYRGCSLKHSNLEYVDEDTAVAMIKDAPRHERIWVCRVERVR